MMCRCRTFKQGNWRGLTKDITKLRARLKKCPTKDEWYPGLALGLTVQRQVYSWGTCQNWKGAGAIPKGESFVG